MRARDLQLRGRFAARHGGPTTVDLKYARDLAERRTGEAATAAIGRQMLALQANGGDVAALAKAMNELLELAEAVKSERPSPTAVAVARRLISPASILSMNGQEGAMDLVVLAYATLHFDEVRALNGGLS